MLAQFGDAGDEALVGGLVHEHSMINFFLSLSLCPFLA